ncbi:type I-C CRISPR-associated protein Cas7/Csd2 [Secundilactobacillus similis DSM 23365 = JCM 2765]|uniref:CRISPR-associated Csd2 family protein n=1 Tax=Secundilactobacillus similis DSM 23365 = JCM 2765 TaxID=1423804 RepID=A0A0R2FIL1_9LACO|nr:type I-C CRISPR-associated protein Cas7/Csd2 [Secundilactobacillus similis]KRN26037.1 CRISPR-associated Csd2 family protein [Secundilactobacillus similis DSM 23365 = JCM 2765]
MTKLEHKIDFSIVIGVKNANPNGDPLDGNRPRVNADGYGEISDVAIKRKIRNRWQDMGKSILVQMQERITDGVMNIRDRVKMSDQVLEAIKLQNDKKSNWRDAFIQASCASWLDVRAFGQVMPFSNKKLKDGLDGVSIGIRGPVSVQAAYTTEPVTIKEEQITKSINLEQDEGKGSDTMGTKAAVPFAIYQCNGSINVEQAQKTGFTVEDAEDLKQALTTLFVNDSSSARPEGSMAVLKLIWWEHSTMLGKVPPYVLHESVKVEVPESARKFDEVKISIEDLNDVNGVTRDIVSGY